MFIHIGDDHVIQSEHVVAIIDYSLVNSSTINDEMLQGLNNRNMVVTSDSDDSVTKSIVITTNNVYYSPLSVLTLKKRASMISTISKLENYSDNSEEEMD